MSGICKVILVGHLGADPEVKYFQDGSAVCNFTVATSEEWNDKNTGEKRKKTEWSRVVAFKRLAEICGQYLTKGSQAYIEGKLQTREWSDAQGVKRYTTEIVAQTVQFLGGKGQGQGQPASQPAPVQPGSPAVPAPAAPPPAQPIAAPVQAQPQQAPVAYQQQPVQQPMAGQAPVAMQPVAHVALQPAPAAPVYAAMPVQPVPAPAMSGGALQPAQQPGQPAIPAQAVPVAEDDMPF